MTDLKKSLNNTLLPNSLPVCYSESSAGRLGPAYGTNFPSVITMSQELKSLLFSGHELFDYDISNAHLSIFTGLCKRYGMECPNIQHYLENKVECRRMWCEDFGVEIKPLKAYILSWLYGANNYPIIRSDLQEDLGYLALEAIQNDNILSRIYDEIQHGQKVICDAHRNSNGLITNILGKEQPLKKKERKNTPGAELSHIQFGIESKIMEVVNSIIGDEQKLLIYDGWISEKVDTKAIEEEVTKQLGFDIKFDVEEIQPPSLEDLMQFKKAKRSRWWKDKKKSA